MATPGLAIEEVFKRTRVAVKQASSGRQIAASEIDLLVRALSMGKLHHAMMGTAAVAIGTAAAIPGTLVNLAAGGGALLSSSGHYPVDTASLTRPDLLPGWPSRSSARADRPASPAPAPGPPGRPPRGTSRRGRGRGVGLVVGDQRQRQELHPN